ncbi:hypothetical protein FEM03_07140 [Phragmitibacter flavus]|uniref:WD40 repeat domain-containing protein n=1 Tax=Phragmitibacter flavus TaxID=2576071 RepID=A0A5R8KG62_9BACT|nr:hypothetical protein [Phragmitibacter flavus]TLD71298.1 hypothetical protein FEM03_07140 [Phragmitibacter flavus]
MTLALLATPAHAVVFYYTHGKEGDGGLARIAVHDQTGQWQGHQTIEGPGLDQPKKLAITKDGGHAVVTSDESDRVWFYQLGGTPKFHKELQLGGETTDIALVDNKLMLTAGEGFFYWIDPKQATIERTWNSEEQMSPSGRKGEDILFLPDKQVALVSFQKDSKKGKHMGSRLLVFDPKPFTPRHDLSLPRNRPELHIAADLREQGPNPELIFVAPKSNTIALTLDLYGALAFADLDAALKGEWKNLEYVSTALDGAWGTSFPDRGMQFEAGGRERLLVSNASDNGGLVLVNLKERKITQTFPAQAGAEHPIWLPTAKKAVTVISGKVKARGSSGLSNEISGTSNELLVFDLAPLEAGGEATMETIEFEGPVTRVEPVSESSNQLLLLLVGAEGAQQWMVYDLATRSVKHREAPKGVVSRIEAWRPQR